MLHPSDNIQDSIFNFAVDFGGTHYYIFDGNILRRIDWLDLRLKKFNESLIEEMINAQVADVVIAAV